MQAKLGRRYFRPKADRIRSVGPRKYYAPIEARIKAEFPNTEPVQYDHHGHMRTLKNFGEGFASYAFTGDWVEHATRMFEAGSAFYFAFRLDQNNGRIGLSPRVDRIPGERVRVVFEQELFAPCQTGILPVLGGYLVVYMHNDGRVYQINSTLRHAERVSGATEICSSADAIQAALALHGGLDAAPSIEWRLGLSEHNDKLDPVYEIKISSLKPSFKSWRYLVKATTGKVVYGSDQLLYAAPTGKALLRIPKPTDIDADRRDYTLSKLVDPKFLRTEQFDMLVQKNDEWKTVEALADGTFNFPSDSPEAEAVSLLAAMQDEDDFAEKNMGHKARRISVYVRDKSQGENNAFFSPSQWEIHILPGSGLDKGGLFIYIGLDSGVGEHENYHKRAAVETVDGDLGGSEGRAFNEAVGDYGDLLSEYRRTRLYGVLYGIVMTVAWILGDPRIIGLLALWPKGLRSQRNKMTVKNKTGEEHNDGQIVGGACCDVMEVLTTDPDVGLEKGLDNACAIMNVALQHCPPHKTTFEDALSAFITGDALLFKGKYRPAIVKSFGDKEIVLTPGAPVKDPEALVRGRFVN